MTKILFVCHGNICRSPMAEFVMKDIVRRRGIADKFHIESAATSREALGCSVHSGTRRMLSAAGIDCSGKRAVQMTRDDYDRFDWLIGMEESNLRDMRRITGGDPDGKIRSLLSFAGSGRGIADPWYTGDFKSTWDDVTEGCEALADFLEKET